MFFIDSYLADKTQPRCKVKLRNNKLAFKMFTTDQMTHVFASHNYRLIYRPICR